MAYGCPIRCWLGTFLSALDVKKKTFSFFQIMWYFQGFKDLLQNTALSRHEDYYYCITGIADYSICGAFRFIVKMFKNQVKYKKFPCCTVLIILQGDFYILYHSDTKGHFWCQRFLENQVHSAGRDTLLSFQMTELKKTMKDQNQSTYWQETGRWGGYEECFDPQSGVWASSHISYLTFKSLIHLRRTMNTGQWGWWCRWKLLLRFWISQSGIWVCCLFKTLLLYIIFPITSHCPLQPSSRCDDFRLRREEPREHRWEDGLWDGQQERDQA